MCVALFPVPSPAVYLSGSLFKRRGTSVDDSLVYFESSFIASHSFHCRHFMLFTFSMQTVPYSGMRGQFIELIGSEVWNELPTLLSLFLWMFVESRAEIQTSFCVTFATITWPIHIHRSSLGLTLKVCICKMFVLLYWEKNEKCWERSSGDLSPDED